MTRRHHLQYPFTSSIANMSSSSMTANSHLEQGAVSSQLSCSPSFLRHESLEPHSPNIPRPDHPLLICLQPIRTVLHRFLSDDDAAYLLRVSRTTALALLPGFTFLQHVFVGQSQQQMLRMRALYEAYDMRPTWMCLSEEVRSLSLEEGSGRSPFPSSLTSLLLGPLPPSDERSVALPMMFEPGAAMCESIHCLCTRLGDRPSNADYNELLPELQGWPVRRFAGSDGPLNCTLQHGLLPLGVRRLQFPNQFNCPLLPLSVPSSVQVMQLADYNQPLLLEGLSVLPSALLHLVLVEFDQPLLPCTLPLSLERLRLHHWNHPLDVNVLPCSLKALDVTMFDHPLLPGALPAGLTHLALDNFSQPLEQGSLPPTLLCFDIGSAFDHPLPSGDQQLDQQSYPASTVLHHYSPTRPPLLPSSGRCVARISTRLLAQP